MTLGGCEVKPVLSLWGWLQGAGLVYRVHLPCPGLVSGSFCEPHASLMGQKFATFRRTCPLTRVVLGPEGHPQRSFRLSLRGQFDTLVQGSEETAVKPGVSEMPSSAATRPWGAG